MLKINDYEFEVFSLISSNKCTHCMKEIGTKKVVFLSNPHMTIDKENELCQDCYETLLEILSQTGKDWEENPQGKKMAEDMGIDPYLIIKKE